MNKLILAASLTLLVGCVSSPPTRAVFARQDLHANLVVVRDNGFVGHGCKVDLLVDDSHQVDLRPGEGAELRVEPGERTITITTRAPCGIMTDSVRAQMSAEHIERFRIRLQQAGARLLAMP